MMKIFCFILVVVVVAADFTPRTAENVLKYDDECGAELKESPERLAEFKKGEFKEDRESFCHVHCVAKKMELFDDEKGTNVENMVKQLLTNNAKPEAEMKKTVEDCIKSSEDKKEDKCVWAFSGFTCLGEHGLKASPV
uniref:CSON002081 protein n=1 Tax=Culicoides sonorensis TaxID=179676 RepID=A0A336MJM2_CULSO